MLLPPIRRGDSGLAEHPPSTPTRGTGAPGLAWTAAGDTTGAAAVMAYNKATRTSARAVARTVRIIASSFSTDPPPRGARRLHEIASSAIFTPKSRDSDRQPYCFSTHGAGAQRGRRITREIERQAASPISASSSKCWTYAAARTASSGSSAAPSAPPIIANDEVSQANSK